MTNSTIRQALQKSRLFLVVGAAIAIEFAIRLALGRGIHPFLYLLTPPVAGLAWFHLAAPISRDTDSDEGSALIGDAPSGTLRPVLFLAVVGHAFAVIIGTALFFAIDTPIQAAMYWHVGHFRSPLFMFFWPVAGLLLGTAIAWTAPALVLAGVRNGHSVTDSLRRSIGAIRLWEFGKLVGTHLLVGIGLVLTAFIVGSIGVYQNSIPFPVLMLGLVLTFSIIIFLTIPMTAAAVGHQQFPRYMTSSDADSAGIPENTNEEGLEHSETNSFEPPHTRTLLSVSVMIVLLLVLGTLGGVARMSELQPAPATKALGSSPDEMYISALHNTETGSTTTLLVIYGRDGADDTRIRVSIDRSNREMYSSYVFERYTSPGVQHFGLTRKDYAEREFHNFLSSTDVRIHLGQHSPGNYFRTVEDFGLLKEGAYYSPSGWNIVNESEDYINLTLTNATDAAQFAGVRSEITPQAEFDVHASIGRENRRLEVLEARYETNSSTNDSVEAHWRQTFDYNFEVERPDLLGSPSIEEYVWRALIY